MKKLFKRAKRVFYDSNTEVARLVNALAEVHAEKSRITQESRRIAAELEALLIEEHGEDPVYIAIPGHEAHWYKTKYMDYGWLKKHYPEIYGEALQDTRAYLVISNSKKK